MLHVNVFPRLAPLPSLLLVLSGKHLDLSANHKTPLKLRLQISTFPAGQQALLSSADWLSLGFHSVIKKGKLSDLQATNLQDTVACPHRAATREDAPEAATCSSEPGLGRLYEAFFG